MSARYRCRRVVATSCRVRTAPAAAGAHDLEAVELSLDLHLILERLGGSTHDGAALAAQGVQRLKSLVRVGLPKRGLPTAAVSAGLGFVILSLVWFLSPPSPELAPGPARDPGGLSTPASTSPVTAASPQASAPPTISMAGAPPPAAPAIAVVETPPAPAVTAVAPDPSIERSARSDLSSRSREPRLPGTAPHLRRPAPPIPIASGHTAPPETPNHGSRSPGSASIAPRRSAPLADFRDSGTTVGSGSDPLGESRHALLGAVSPRGRQRPRGDMLDLFDDIK